MHIYEKHKAYSSILMLFESFNELLKMLSIKAIDNNVEERNLNEKIEEAKMSHEGIKNKLDE